MNLESVRRSVACMALIATMLVSPIAAQTFPGDDAERLNMTMVGYVQLSDTPVSLDYIPPYTDIYVAGHHAYVGSFYGEVYIIDISNPADMALVATLEMPGPALDLKVDGDLLAIGMQGAGDMGLGLVDISDPAEPKILSTLFEEGWIGVHNLFLYNDRAYLAHASSGGVTIVDISDPAHPVVTGHWDNEMGEYSNIVHDIHISDDMAFFCDFWPGEGGLIILDLQDPDRPVTLSAVPIPEGVHNAWRRGDYVYFNQEFGGGVFPLHVVDIAEPANPVRVGTFYPDRVLRDRSVWGAHNTWIEGDLLYWAYYDAGVRVFDLSVPDHPVEIGYHTAVSTWGTQPHSDGLIYSIDNWQGGVASMRFHQPAHAIRKVELGQTVGIKGRTGGIGVQAWTAPLPGGEGDIRRISIGLPGVVDGELLHREDDHRYVGRMNIPEDMPSGRHQVQVMLEDDQGRFYPFNVPFALFPGGDLPILTENRGWTVENPGNYSWTNYEGRPAMELPPSINLILNPAAPQDLFGYGAIRIVYHPGEGEDARTNNLRFTFDAAPLPLYSSRLENPPIDLTRKEWQVVEIPLVWSETFRLAPAIQTLKLQGRMRGDSYLASIELVADTPPIDTAIREEHADTLPEVFALEQNYPNPFNSSTAIRFDLATAADIELGVYNLAGQRVAILATGVHSAGAYAVHWDGRDARGFDLASGIYLYRVSADGHEQTRKLTLLR